MPKNNLKKYLYILPIGLVILGGFILGTNLSKNSGMKKYAYKDAGSKVLGTSVTNQSITVSAEGYKSDPLTGGLESGKQKMTVTVSLANNSAETLQFSPGLNLKLLGSDGSEYLPTMKFYPADQTIGGPINSGSSARYDIDFELPSSATPKQLIYQKDESSKKLEINL